MNWINVGILLLKLYTSFVCSKTEGKHWLGPTKYTWADFQCAALRFDNELEQKDLDDLGVCKEECEKKESCNAILVADATCNDRPCIKCQLRNCTLPVPAPCGPNGECRRGEMADSEFQGYYHAAALLKCSDMNEVDLGSTKCNDTGNGNVWEDNWRFNSSWDDAQNCLPGCISRMNEHNLTEACCEYMGGEKGGIGACILNDAVDVIQGNENSSTYKAVKCQVEPLTDTQASSDTSKTSATTKLDSISTSTTDMSAINPEDPDDGADSGSSTCKLNGKKKTFLMIHVTITQILLMLLVIKHKNV